MDARDEMSTFPQPRLRDMLSSLVRHSPRYARLTRRILTDSRISAMDKAPLIGAIGYGLSPIDLVPGIVPVLGQLDDMVVLLGALRLTLHRISPDVANEHLLAVGLIMADIDEDLVTCRRAAGQLVSSGIRGTGRVVRTGTRLSLRLAGLGVRMLRSF